MFTSFRLRIANFFRKHKRTVFGILLAWVIIIFINDFFKNNSFESFQRTTYSPNTPVIDTTGQTVPDNLKQPINTLVDTYFNYCNTKQYDKAYAMLSQECKNIYYPTLQDFKDYVDLVFNENKVYYMQNYSNYNNVYIYRIRIMEDILKTGLTGESDIQYYEEKIAISQDASGKLWLSIREFITTEPMDVVYEDDYMKVRVLQRDVFYENETYTVEVKNKSDYIMVLADGTENPEMALQVGSSTRAPNDSNLYVVIQPGETQTFTVNFTKFYDESSQSTGLTFNAVRVLKTYSGSPATKQYELDNAVKLYSAQVVF